ncbi:MAG: TIGR04086 family membrane protein [Defluviitaleaceae bacterium]|nr:TIGR04086 family membrane protein [Defluviitaleaceae bacterium]
MNREQMDTRKRQILGLVMGVVIAYAITATAFIATAVGITYTSLQETTIPIIVMITCVVAVIIAGFDASRKAASRGWLWGMAAGGLYAVILILIIVWINGGFVLDSRKIILTLLSVVGGGIGGAIGINFKK